MPRRKIEDRMIRKLSKVGGGKTYSITLPVEIIREFKWKEGQKLVVERNKGKTIKISDWKDE